MDGNSRLEVVEAENATLRERIRTLEAALCETPPLPFEWGLTASEARVFGVLVNRPVASKDAVMAALYRDLGKDEAAAKIADVFICKLRRKLKPFGIIIKTRWGEGWYLEPPTRSQFSRAA